MYPLATKTGFKSWQLAGGLLVSLLVLVLTYLLVRPEDTPYSRAVALIKAGKAAAALPILEELSRQHPDNASLFPWLAQGYLSTERLGEGRTALDTALRLKLPASVVVPVVLSYAACYENKGDFEEAEKLFASAQAVYKDQQLVAGKAQLYLAWAESEAIADRWQQASGHLETAYKLQPQLDGALRTTITHRLSDYYRQMAALAETRNKDDKEAIRLLEKALTVSDEPATRMAVANIYSRRGKIDQAINCYRRVSVSDANNLEARHRLIELLVQKKDYISAQESLIELTDKERSVENYQLLASLDLKLGNHAGAVRALEDASSLRPKDLTLLRPLERLLVDWSVLLAKQGKTQEAMSVRGHAARVLEMIGNLAKKEEEGKQEGKPEEKEGESETAAEGGSAGPELAEAKPAPQAEPKPWPASLPPIALCSSRIWLAKGSLTPEGEIAIRNISGRPITDLSLTLVFYDNTSRSRNGTITMPVAGSRAPFAVDTKRTLYFSCPNIVKVDHQLAVIIFWKGRLLKELPVVKQR